MTATEKALKTIQERTKRVRFLLDQQDKQAARIQLVSEISRAVSYHKSGKIEGIFSLDVSCSNCQFCQRMKEDANPTTVCRLCYTGNMYETSKAAHAITGEILSRMELTREEATAVAIPSGLFRFNSDGELINLTHALNLVRIAIAHPSTTFAIWTKRAGLLARAFEKEEKPGNLIVGVSSQFINDFAGTAQAIHPDFIFTVYTPRGIEQAVKDGQRECNGKKCRDCGFKCYQWPISDSPARVAEVLRRPCRMSKASFEKLCADIDAQTL